MAWFEDLTQCDYFGSHLADSLRAVGWLQRDRPYPTGAIDAEVFAKIADLARDPWQPSVAAGPHSCDLCLYEPEASCSANLFVPGDGSLYVCPTLITHYMNAHGYAPPPAFCRAILACPTMRSMPYMKSVLASGGRLLMRSATT
jgi:hypothetical protein